MSFRSVVQAVNLIVFLLLLFLSTYSVVATAKPDLYLRLDPVIAVGTVLSSKTLSLAFLPALIVLVLVPIIGRMFCGYICPMGTTIDATDTLLKSIKKNKSHPEGLRRIKYYLLSFIVGAALLGVSLVFIASPISLITRFYGLVIYPVLMLFAEMGLWFIQPVAEKLGMYLLVFAEMPVARFATQFFVLIFFLLVFSAVRISPRFWCRYLCPSGALMALLSPRPVLRRTVSDDCTSCGKCTRACPMNAIDMDGPALTRHQECIVCTTCEAVCPVDAVSFKSSRKTKHEGSAVSFSKRKFLYSGIAGFGTAAVSLTGINSLYGKPGLGQVALPGLVRPPGAVPEMEFLARCVRCGECMVACPGNTLQPVWLDSGIMGVFSPALTPKRGPCSPDCNNCGNVCPTGAIRPLPLEERRWAKPGTAEINQRRCLAWEQQKRCMVCDEVCPFGAVEFRLEQGNPVPVPEVIESRCAGCGYCEHHCPVQNQAAIFVTPMGELRLSKGSFQEQGRQEGLNISIKPEEEDPYPLIHEEPPYGSAPGFDVGARSDTAPGFDVEQTYVPAGSVDEEEKSGAAPGFDIEEDQIAPGFIK